MYGLKQKNIHKEIDDALQLMGITKFANKKVEQFSGGMKRRCNLLAGTLHNPKVLFLTSQLSGVDVQSKKAIIDYLLDLNKKGTCIIYTSHHLSEAEEFCTKIAIIDHGKNPRSRNSGRTHQPDSQRRKLRRCFYIINRKRIERCCINCGEVSSKKFSC